MYVGCAYRSRRNPPSWSTDHERARLFLALRLGWVVGFEVGDDVRDDVGLEVLVMRRLMMDIQKYERTLYR